MTWAGRRVQRIRTVVLAVRVQRIRTVVLAVYGPMCWLCARPIGRGDAWDVDHVRPRSRGGGDRLANLRPAHASCNRARGAREVPAGAVSWQL